jgi:hypothetical protein
MTSGLNESPGDRTGDRVIELCSLPKRMSAKFRQAYSVDLTNDLIDFRLNNELSDSGVRSGRLPPAAEERQAGPLSGQDTVTAGRTRHHPKRRIRVLA